MKKLSVIVLLVLLTACTPVKNAVQDAVSAVGKGDDGALMTLSDESVAFMPNGAAFSVVLTVVGEGVSTSDEDCVVTAPDAVECFLGDVSEARHVSVSGGGIAWVSYLRDVTSFRVLTFYVTR